MSTTDKAPGKTPTTVRRRTTFDWRHDVIHVGFVVVVIMFSILLRDQDFISTTSLMSILRQTAIATIIAAGMTYVIVAAEIDPSVGSVAGLASVLTAMTLSHFGLVPGILAGLFVGVTIGAINGALVAFAKIPSFLVILAMMGIAFGVAQWITASAPQPILNMTYNNTFGGSSIGPIPILVVWMLVVVIVGSVVSKEMRFGRQVLVTGANKVAAECSGIKTHWIRSRVMLICSVGVALTGMLYAGRLQSGRLQWGQGDEMNAIAVVILGGMALSGGRGSVIDTSFGALLMAIINYGLILAGLDTSQQQTVRGLIVVLAVALARQKQPSSTKGSGMSKTHGRDITVDGDRFLINGEQRDLYDGAVHYWRLDWNKWDSILESVKSMGFDMISTYIPWEIREVSKGEFDFLRNKDIDAFLTLCENKGFAIVVRPGPQINSKLTWLDYPKRILENERLQVRNARGARTMLTQVPKPIPTLNYAEDEFFDEIAFWYDAIYEILARHVHPKGGIVAAQVDDEMAYFFCINAYAVDFSDASLRNYRASLSSKYGSLEKINEVHGITMATIAEVDAPRRFEATKASEIPRYADWIEYRENYLIDSIARLADMMRERGFDAIALFHNYLHPLGPGGAASGLTTPFNIVKLEEKFDFVGLDIYSRKELYSHVKTAGSYVVGTSRYPYIPEFIAGV